MLKGLMDQLRRNVVACLAQATAGHRARRIGSTPHAYAAVVAGIVAISATFGGSATAAAADMVADLEPGQSAYWSGPFIERARVDAPELCDIEGPCFSYGIRVGAGEARHLRVAIDWSERGDAYRLDLFDPDGEVVATRDSSGWSVELFAERPRPGVWTARVIPSDVTESRFEGRARLDLPVPSPVPPVVLLPNLQVNPPWELTLVGPISSTLLNVAPRPATVLGQTLWSCAPEEQLVNGATRCLRFSAGPMNTGRGPYEARFDPLSGEPVLPEEALGEGLVRGPVTQRIYRSDGTYFDRDAGHFEVHPVHMHFHVQDVLRYRLHRVADPQSGRMEVIGSGRKASFCTYDLMLVEWGRFTSEPSRYPNSTVCYQPATAGTTELAMGITPGWSDVYDWNLADQYVDFAGGGEGEYVIQVEVDPANTILESDDGDNLGYAHIQITGESVHLIERGIGSSPWDPAKVVLDLLP